MNFFKQGLLFQDPCVPPSERCAYKTDKEPTGPFDRKKLMDYLEKKAKEEKDWEDPKPYTKEIRGKYKMGQALLQKKSEVCVNKASLTFKKS